MEVSSFGAGANILAREAENQDLDDFETFLRERLIYRFGCDDFRAIGL